MAATFYVATFFAIVGGLACSLIAVYEHFEKKGGKR